MKSTFLLETWEIDLFANLAHMVKNSKQNVGRRMLDAADSAIKQVEKMRAAATPAAVEKPADKRCKLAVGETCIWCNSVGRAKPKAKGPPTCARCRQQFHRNVPWRILRGKRVHVLCVTAKHSCGHCSYEESNGELIEQCAACKAKDQTK